ncbi:MBG domain-containing protein [Salinimicrobium sp. GXAS 041]|uniref:MBG domain-containing protein n=1 Tax=Salinimicrobium sp. GXAS 041 TaxID=3400806 RepID=UPI003C72DB46
MKQKLLFLIFQIFCFTYVLSSHAQTLQAGDIAFIGFNTDAPDGFSFIALKDLPAGETLYFTEEGWGQDQWGNEVEPHLKWVIPSGITVGTVVSVVETNTSNTFTVSGSSNGVTHLSPNDKAFSLFAGDQILAYQSTSGPRPSTPTFIAAVNGDYNSEKYDATTKWNNWNPTNGSAESLLPPGLTNGVNAVSLFPAPGPEVDNAKYNGPLSGTADEIRTLINNPSSWISDNNNPYDISPSSYATPNITPAATNTPPSFNNGASTTLTVNENSGSTAINDLLAVTDIDSGNNLSWSVSSSPSHGNLSGFPASATSNGGSVTPSNLTYTPTSGYSGNDSFTIKVDDGTDSDEITVKVSVNPKQESITSVIKWTDGSNGNSATTGEDGIPAVTLGTFRLDAGDTAPFTNYNNFVYENNLENTGQDATASLSVVSTHQKGVGYSLVEISGAEFSLDSWVFISQADRDAGGNFRMQGYRDGVKVVESDFLIGDIDLAEISTIKRGIDYTGTEWQNIDEVYFIHLGTNVNKDNGDSRFAMGHITVSSAVGTPATNTPPIVSTTAASGITATTATLGGNVTDNGGATVTDRGFVYGVSSPPTIGDGRATRVQDGNGTGTFEEAITNLSAETTYYVRAYAINSEGTSYGAEEVFKTNAVAVDPLQLLYWPNENKDKIEVASLNGASRQDVVTIGASGSIIAIDIDQGNEKAYWFDQNASKIYRSNLDGTNIEEFVSNSGYATSLFVDHVNEYLYWPNNNSSKIERIKLDGTGREDVISATDPIGISVDVSDSKVYWYDQTNGSIYRGNLDGSGSEEFISNPGYATTLYIDQKNKYLYWPNYESSKIERIKLDRTGRADVVSASDAIGISIDVNNSKVYWYDSVKDNINRASLDGTGSEVFISNSGYATTLSIPWEMPENNIPPSFNNGASTELTVNENSENTAINDLLAVTNNDSGDNLTWNVSSGPTHGSLGGFPASATSNGGSITPSGLTYKPTTGYSGEDSFTIKVDDGTNSDEITVNVAIMAGPESNCLINSTEETTSFDVNNLNLNEGFGHSFTSCGNGILKTLEIYAAEASNNVSISIYSGVGNSGNLLGSKSSINFSAGTSFEDRNKIDFSDLNITLQEGNVYSWVITAGKLNTHFTSQNIYNGGTLTLNNIEYSTNDLLFSVEIGTSIPDPEKSAAIITADATQTFAYDGTVKNVSAKLNHSETALTYAPAQGFTNAGTYEITVASEETDNYLSASEKVILVIKKAEIEGVAFEGDTFTYNGETHSLAVSGLPEGATVMYENNDQINAGTYKVSATVSQENYNDKVLTADLVIKKAEAVITANATQTFTYDGTVKNVSAKLNHSETALTYAPAQGFTNAGTYEITVASEETDNYLSASEKVILVIKKAEIEGVAFEGDTFTYNGETHSLAVSGLPEGATVMYENNDQINAGTYKVSATVSQENYNDKVLTADLVIKKAEAVITANATQTFTYDGTVKNVSAKLNHSETALTYAPAQGFTNAGTYEITVASEETDNYLSASEKVSLVIENAEIEGVVFEGDSFIYDGTAHSIFVENLPEGATVKYDNNGKTNAGIYKVTATVSQENYNDEVLTANLVIKKAEAVIIADAVQTFTYDGTVKNVSASLNHEETELTYTPAQGFTNAGTYSVTVASAETDNYLSASEKVSLVIENAEIEGLTFKGDTFIYDGEIHNLAVTGLPEGATVKYENNDQINAGTYKVTATVSQENYNDEVLTANLVINKAEAVITADAVQTFTYDGTVKNVSASLNHEETKLTYAPAQGFTNAGNYPVTISAEETDNYLSASEKVSLVIEKAEIEGVTFKGDTFIYNGETHSLAVSGLPEGATVKYENNDQINAGTYKVTATVSQENYNDKVLTANLVINKAEAIITAGAVQTFTYDGTVKNVSVSLNHSETALTYTPAQGFTNAGIYDVTISAEETDNYLSASEEVSLVIKKADIEGVVFEDDSFVYDGTAHSIFVENLPEGASVKYADNGQINAGTYKVTATVSQENYNDEVLSANLVINKAEAVITAEAVQTFTYDGTVKNVSAKLNHEEIALTYAPAQGFTNAGTYDVTISAEETDNYLSASEEVSLVIEKADIEGVVFEGDSFVYDGTAHSIFVTGLPEGATVKYGNNGQINAGTYKVTATVSQENYNDQVLTADLVINKAEAIITAEAVQTFTYDGTVKNVSAKLNHAETKLTYAPAQGFTNAGTYDVTISAEETDNYLSASKDVSLVIENAEIEGVTFKDDTFIYNGETHSLAVSGLPEGATVKYENNDQINAGTYKVTATVSQENYNDKVLTANLVINKAEAIITAGAVQTFTYDGTVKNVSASLNHEETALTYTPAQGFTNAGTYEVTVSAEETDNYLSASEKVSLVIENAEIEGVVFEGKSFVYDETAHSIYVTGLPEGASVKYADNGQINAGTYKVTATVSQENYNDEALTANLVINKAEAIITADAVQTFTYDGTVKNVSASLNHSETALTYTPAQGFINAGTYEVTVSAEETDNYLSASEKVSLEIENAEIEGVVFEGESFVYDGTAHSIFVENLPEGASVKYADNEQINAGTYKVTATVSQENYNDEVLTADLVIKKAVAVITAEAVQTFTYDGTVKNVSAKLNHEETALTYASEQGYVNSGTYDVTISAEETDNYLSASEEVSLVIENAEIEGVTLESEEFTYNGDVHNLNVSGLPEGATVKYENNDKTNAGTYKVTATVSQENFNDLQLTADLVIKKADQNIIFDALEDVVLRDTDYFMLNATASSGLPVSYSFTYDSENPAATVTERGFVRPLEAGQITITANQAGNENYKEATSVSRSLTITGSHARLKNVVINGSTYSNPSEEIYYLINCGNSENEVKIQLEPITGASVDEEDVFVIPTPAPGIYTRDVTVTSEDGSDARSYRIKIEKTFNFEDVVIQKFNNVLLVNNNPETNGGYKFVKFDWYKNNSYVGSGQYFSEGPNAGDRLDANSTFYVVMTTEEGEVLQTCATSIKMKSTYEVFLTPNPVDAGGQMELHTDFPEEELETMEIFIHTLNGDLLEQMKSNKKVTTIQLSGRMQEGVYILTCKTGTRTKTLKFIVK